MVLPLLLVLLLGAALHSCVCGGARLPEPGGPHGVGAIEVDVPVPAPAASLLELSSMLLVELGQLCHGVAAPDFFRKRGL